MIKTTLKKKKWKKQKWLSETLQIAEKRRERQRKKKCKKSKWLSVKALQIDEKRREAKGKGEREGYIQLNIRFQRRARRDEKKPS